MGIPLLLAILVACGSGTTGGSSTPAATGSTTIKIGTDLPTSCKDESSGKPAEDGANLAVMQANQKHTIPGYTLAFVPKDDVGPSGLHDPTVGAANVTALISDALVAGIVGPFNSSVAKAEMPIANQAPIAQITPANTNPCLTKDTAASGCSGTNNLLPTLRPTGKVSYFRIATTDDHQGPAGADYLYKQNVKKVYVIDDATPTVLVLPTPSSASGRRLVEQCLVIVASQARPHPMCRCSRRSPLSIPTGSTLAGWTPLAVS